MVTALSAMFIWKHAAQKRTSMEYLQMSEVVRLGSKTYISCYTTAVVVSHRQELPYGNNERHTLLALLR